VPGREPGHTAMQHATRHTVVTNMRRTARCCWAWNVWVV